MKTKTRKRHRRMLEELQKLVDKACDSDRLFFERKRPEVPHPAQSPC
jgi:type II secretory pathway predicted ATPase ExeA